MFEKRPKKVLKFKFLFASKVNEKSICLYIPHRQTDRQTDKFFHTINEGMQIFSFKNLLPPYALGSQGNETIRAVVVFQ